MELFVLLLSLILTVLEVVVIQHNKLLREFELFVKDTEKYVILISILSHAVELLNLTLGTPSTHILECKFSAPVFSV